MLDTWFKMLVRASIGDPVSCIQIKPYVFSEDDNHCEAMELHL